MGAPRLHLFLFGSVSEHQCPPLQTNKTLVDGANPFGRLCVCTDVGGPEFALAIKVERSIEEWTAVRNPQCSPTLDASAKLTQT